MMQMIDLDGATPAGDPPRAADVRSLLDARDFGEAGTAVESFASASTSVEWVRRDRVGDQTRTAFNDARAADDLQAQIDAIWSILTGVEP